MYELVISPEPMEPINYGPLTLNDIWIVSAGIYRQTFGMVSVHASEAGALAAVDHLRNHADPYNPGREIEWDYDEWDDIRRWDSGWGTVEMKRVGVEP